MLVVTKPIAEDSSVLAAAMSKSMFDLRIYENNAFVDALRVSYAYIYTTKSHIDISDAIITLNNSGQNSYRSIRVNWHTNVKLSYDRYRPKLFGKVWKVRDFIWKITTDVSIHKIKDTFVHSSSILYDPVLAYDCGMIVASCGVGNIATIATIQSKLNNRILSSKVAINLYIHGYDRTQITYFLQTWCMVFSTNIRSIEITGGKNQYNNINVYDCDYNEIYSKLKTFETNAPRWYKKYIIQYDTLVKIKEYNHQICVCCNTFLTDEQYVVYIIDANNMYVFYDACFHCVHSKRFYKKIIRIWRVRFPISTCDLLRWQVSQAEYDYLIYLHEMATRRYNGDLTALMYDRNSRTLTIGDRYVGISGKLLNYEQYADWPGKILVSISTRH